MQFALIISSGMPTADAIKYFYPDETETPLRAILEKWMRSELVQGAILELQGKSWQEMSIEERIKYAIDKHYSEMAYFLYSRNYAELVGADKVKADTCRQTLEAKLAGMAGKMDALSSFWSDVASGKVSLGPSKVVSSSTVRPS